MSFGLVELITLLLSLSGFSLQQNPKPATADQALQYAMPEPDITVQIDASAIIGNNYKLLLALPQQPNIKSSPELSKTVAKVINEVDGLKGLVKTVAGVDLTTDVANGTLFVQLPPPRGQPELVLAVRGKFTTATIDRIAKVAGPATKIGGGALIELPPGQFGPLGAIAVTKDGTLLAGTTKLVKDRLADAWKAPARPATGTLAQVAAVIDAKPVFAIALSMSAAAKTQAATEFKNKKNFLSDVIARHKFAALSLFTDGVGYTWVDSTKAGLDAMAEVADGTFEMMRAAHVAPRAMAKILSGAMESYRGTNNKQVDELLKRKADLQKIVETYTGDGKFKVTVDKNPATLRLTARATGKSLSDVVPAGMLLPGAMWLLVARSAPEPPMTMPGTPMTTQPKPAPPKLTPPAPKAPAPKPPAPKR